MNNLHHTFLFIIFRFVYLNLYDNNKIKKKIETLRFSLFFLI